MTNLRAAFAALVVALLAAGSAGAARAALGGDPTEWARKADDPAIRTLALVVLVGAIVLAFVPEKGPDRESEP